MNFNVSIITGDLIKEATEKPMIDVLVHGCNCFCTMGGGIALQIKKIFPEAYLEDQNTISGDKNKLGTYTSYTYHYNYAPIKRHHLTVVNAYTQYRFGKQKDTCYFDYTAFEKLVIQFNSDFKGKIVAMPWIGCGLAGGNKNKVLDILNKNVKTFKCWIYELPMVNPS